MRIVDHRSVITAAITLARASGGDVRIYALPEWHYALCAPGDPPPAGAQTGTPGQVSPQLVAITTPDGTLKTEGIGP